MLYTGRWATFFERWAREAPAVDLLSRFEPHRPGWFYGKGENCRLWQKRSAHGAGLAQILRDNAACSDANREPCFRRQNATSACYQGVTSKGAADFAPRAITNWPVLRMSRVLAAAIVSALRSGGYGHHEAHTALGDGSQSCTLLARVHTPFEPWARWLH